MLGCLIEKQRATPDVYPLLLNALRLASNQSTDRYDEPTIHSALDRLTRKGWVRLASGQEVKNREYCRSPLERDAAMRSAAAWR